MPIESSSSSNPTPFETDGSLETFLRTVVLRDHIRSMTDQEAGAFVRDVVARLPRLELDHVRLNIHACR